MPELKGSKTEQNLWTAFAGESQARIYYTLLLQSGQAVRQILPSKTSPAERPQLQAQHSGFDL